MKLCTKCNQEKPFSSFSVVSKTNGKLRSGCKACRSQHALNQYYSDPKKHQQKAILWKKSNRALVNEGAKRWRQDGAGSVSELLSQAKKRAKRNGLPFTLKPADIEIPEFCPVFGVPLLRGTGRGPTPSSPSLDKIIPALGYVPGNVMVISQKANAMKNSASPAELLMFADWIRNTVARPLTGDLVT